MVPICVVSDVDENFWCFNDIFAQNVNWSHEGGVICLSVYFIPWILRNILMNFVNVICTKNCLENLIWFVLVIYNPCYTWSTNHIFIIFLRSNLSNRVVHNISTSAQTLATRSPWQLTCVWCHLILVNHQCGTLRNSTLWAPIILQWLLKF
jgi:hypothetical protein